MPCSRENSPLISLAAGVFLLATIYQQNRMVPLNVVEWSAIATTGLCFLGTVASGAFLSSDKPMPVLTALATAATLYLLLGMQQG